MVAGGIAVLAILAYLPFPLVIPEPERRPMAQGRPAFWTILLALQSTPGALPTLGLFAGTVLTLVTLQSILPFWLDRGPGLSAGGQTLVLLTVFLSTIGSLPIWAWIARRLCKLRCLAIGLAVFLSGLAIALELPVGAGQSAGLFLAAGLAGAGAGALSMCPWAMIPDVAEAHALRLGAAVEGTTSAAFTMTNKLAAASALFLNSATLAVTGAEMGPTAAPFALLLLPLVLALGTGAATLAILSMREEPRTRNSP
jgi:Na+/melibiose symporter-like transporter